MSVIGEGIFLTSLGDSVHVHGHGYGQGSTVINKKERNMAGLINYNSMPSHFLYLIFLYCKFRKMFVCPRPEANVLNLISGAMY